MNKKIRHKELNVLEILRLKDGEEISKAFNDVFTKKGVKVEDAIVLLKFFIINDNYLTDEQIHYIKSFMLSINKNFEDDIYINFLEKNKDVENLQIDFLFKGVNFKEWSKILKIKNDSNYVEDERDSDYFNNFKNKLISKYGDIPLQELLFQIDKDEFKEYIAGEKNNMINKSLFGKKSDSFYVLNEKEKKSILKNEKLDDHFSFSMKTFFKKQEINNFVLKTKVEDFITLNDGFLELKNKDELMKCEKVNKILEENKNLIEIIDKYIKEKLKEISNMSESYPILKNINCFKDILINHILDSYDRVVVEFYLNKQKSDLFIRHKNNTNNISDFFCNNSRNSYLLIDLVSEAVSRDMLNKMQDDKRKKIIEDEKNNINEILDIDTVQKFVNIIEVKNIDSLDKILEQITLKIKNNKSSYFIENLVRYSPNLFVKSDLYSLNINELKEYFNDLLISGNSHMEEKAVYGMILCKNIIREKLYLSLNSEEKKLLKTFYADTSRTVMEDEHLESLLFLSDFINVGSLLKVKDNNEDLSEKINILLSTAGRSDFHIGISHAGTANFINEKMKVYLKNEKIDVNKDKIIEFFKNKSKNIAKNILNIYPEKFLLVEGIAPLAQIRVSSYLEIIMNDIYKEEKYKNIIDNIDLFKSIEIVDKNQNYNSFSQSVSILMLRKYISDSNIIKLKKYKELFNVIDYADINFLDNINGAFYDKNYYLIELIEKNIEQKKNILEYINNKKKDICSIYNQNIIDSLVRENDLGEMVKEKTVRLNKKI